MELYPSLLSTKTGLLQPLISSLPASAASAPDATGFVLGSVVAVLCNVVNNLPLGLIAGSVANGAHLAPHVTGALLIGVDLGPNLSVTGSLATILWLVALRREGQAVSEVLGTRVRRHAAGTHGLVGHFHVQHIDVARHR